MKRLAPDVWLMDGFPPFAINAYLVGKLLVDAASRHGRRRILRRLVEGDEVAGFSVMDVPGHSAGHIALWRESDRVLICGDVFTNMDTTTGIPGLHEPKAYFTPDPERNRGSMRRLAALEPSLVCFGHGRPLRDPGKLREFVASLPRP